MVHLRFIYSVPIIVANQITMHVMTDFVAYYWARTGYTFIYLAFRSTSLTIPIFVIFIRPN